MPILQASAASAEEAAYGSMLTAVWGTQLDQGGAVVEIGMGGRPFIFWGVKAGMILEQLFMFVFLVGLCFLF